MGNRINKRLEFYVLGGELVKQCLQLLFIFSQCRFGAPSLTHFTDGMISSVSVHPHTVEEEVQEEGKCCRQRKAKNQERQI